MMEKIRVAANHIVVKIIFALIILSFIFAGASGILGIGSGDDSQYIAKVDGEGLSREAFEAQAKAATDNAASLNLAGDDRDSFFKNIRREVLAYQINNYLAYEFSNSLNVKISNEQVKNAIRQQEVFMVNGKFSNARYLELLALNGYTPEIYAESLRTQMMQQQMIQALSNSEFVLPTDSDISLLKNQVRTAYVTTISPQVSADDITISDEEALNFYKDNQQFYEHKERVKLKFIANFRPDIVVATTVSNKEIEEFYQQNKTKYSTIEKYSYSAIYVSDLDTANDVYAALGRGENFIDLVNNISIYPKNNGYLGWFFNDENLPMVFVEANLVEKGTFSKPIQTEDGFVIVRLDDIQEPEVMELDYVRESIKEQLMDEKSEKVFEHNNTLLEEALANNLSSLEQISEISGLPVLESDWSYRDDNISLSRYPEIREVIFGPDMINDGSVTGNFSDLIYVDSIKSTYIVQVIDYQPEGLSSFEEVKESIIQGLKLKKASDGFNLKVNSTVDNLNNKITSDGITFSQKYSVNRTSDSLDKNTIDMIFSLVPSADGSSVHGASFMSNNQAMIAAMIKVENPTEKEDLSEQLKPNLIRNIQYFFNNDLRSKADIKIMPNSNL